MNSELLAINYLFRCSKWYERSNTMETKNKYEEIGTFRRVALNLPVKAEPVKAHEMTVGPKKIQVPFHRRRGKQITKDIFVNRNFYGFVPSEFGKEAITKVRVMRVTHDNGKKYIILDIFPESNKKKATCDLVFSKGDKGIYIPGTGKRVFFKPRHRS